MPDFYDLFILVGSPLMMVAMVTSTKFMISLLMLTMMFPPAIIVFVTDVQSFSSECVIALPVARCVARLPTVVLVPASFFATIS